MKWPISRVASPSVARSTNSASTSPCGLERFNHQRYQNPRCRRTIFTCSQSTGFCIDLYPAHIANRRQGASSRQSRMSSSKIVHCHSSQSAFKQFRNSKRFSLKRKNLLTRKQGGMSEYWYAGYYGGERSSEIHIGPTVVSAAKQKVGILPRVANRVQAEVWSLRRDIVERWIKGTIWLLRTVVAFVSGQRINGQ